MILNFFDSENNIDILHNLVGGILENTVKILYLNLFPLINVIFVEKMIHF